MTTRRCRWFGHKLRPGKFISGPDPSTVKPEDTVQVQMMPLSRQEQDYADMFYCARKDCVTARLVIPKWRLTPRAAP